MEITARSIPDCYFRVQQEFVCVDFPTLLHVVIFRGSLTLRGEWFFLGVPETLEMR